MREIVHLDPKCRGRLTVGEGRESRQQYISGRLEFEVPAGYQCGRAVGRVIPLGEKDLLWRHRFWRYQQHISTPCGHEVVQEGYVKFKDTRARGGAVVELRAK